MPKIRSYALADGSRRYRFVADTGRGPDGRRQQRTYTYAALRDAKTALARVTHTVATGEFVGRSRMTVSEMCDSYEASKAHKSANTRESYRNALKPARERLGGRLARTIEREDIQELCNWMLATGRRRGGRPGTALSRRSAELALGRLSAAFELAVRDRRLAVNPARYVELPGREDREPQTWSAEEVRKFLCAAAADRLHAAWRLTLYGLRRAEVLGLRWEEDVDLDAGTITIAETHPLVGGEIVVKGPKSRRGRRTLPLDAADVAALRALHDRQVTEAMDAGEAYEASGYVVVDELGAPVSPRWYSEEFHRLRERAGLPRITLREGRATASTLMADAGVPDHIRAAWCGHRVEVNVSNYTAVRPERLADAAGVLSKIRDAM